MLRSADAPIAQTEAEAPPDDSGPVGATIVVVADSVLSAAVDDALAPSGHLVSSVPDGERALGLATGDTTADLVLIDADLPGLAAADLCRALRALGLEAPILLISSKPDQMASAPEAGAYDVVRTPLVAAELTVRVRAALQTGGLTEQLRCERDRSAALVSSIQDGLLLVDGEGRIVEANRRVSEITGFALDQIIGARPPYPFWPQARADDYARTLRRALRRGDGEETDREYVRDDGSPLDVIVSLAPVRGAAPSEPVFVSTVKNVTARRAAERALRDSEARHRALAAEQARLGRVAARVATCEDPSEVFALVAEEVAGLLGADAGGVTRFEQDSAVLVGSWAARDDLRLPVGARLPLGIDSATSRVWREGAIVRIDDYSDLIEAPALGEVRPHLSSVAAPVDVGGSPWGTVGAISARRGGFAAGAEDRLEEFAALVGVAVTGADARAELARQARTDPLTGLVNRRGFEERLERVLIRCRTQGGDLALAMFDIDHFKAVNDRYGHEAGDRVLGEVARRIGDSSRAGDLVARIGGEEFVLLLDEAAVGDAAAAAERVRVAVAATPIADVGTCTISCGVADWRPGDSAASLMRRADERLYRAKERGRDRVVSDDAP